MQDGGRPVRCPAQRTAVVQTEWLADARACTSTAEPHRRRARDATRQIAPLTCTSATGFLYHDQLRTPTTITPNASAPPNGMRGSASPVFTGSFAHLGWDELDEPHLLRVPGPDKHFLTSTLHSHSMSAPNPVAWTSGRLMAIPTGPIRQGSPSIWRDPRQGGGRPLCGCMCTHSRPRPCAALFASGLPAPPVSMAPRCTWRSGERILRAARATSRC